MALLTAEIRAPYVNSVRFADPRRTGGARTVRDLARQTWIPKVNDLARRANALALRETT